MKDEKATVWILLISGRLAPLFVIGLAQFGNHRLEFFPQPQQRPEAGIQPYSGSSGCNQDSAN